MRKLARGFTLIELLVVISIIGILTTLVAANLNSARSRARDAQRKSDLRNIATSLRLYFNDWSVYPASDASGNINGCGTGVGTPTTTCTWGSPWTNGTIATYMPTLAKDPVTGQSYYYNRVSDDTYTLSACLENKSDSSGKTNDVAGFSCSTSWIFQIQP